MYGEEEYGGVFPHVTSHILKKLLKILCDFFISTPGDKNVERSYSFLLTQYFSNSLKTTLLFYNDKELIWPKMVLSTCTKLISNIQALD